MAPTFTFDGQAVPYQPGDTFASALHRKGVKVLSRSLKYHRPRGIYCNMGSCASCFVDVDGIPNVAACMARAKDGARLRSQNRIGSAKHDLLGLVDKVYRDSFDPHDAFTRPKVLNDAFLRGVRFMSGLGRPPSPERSPASASRHLLHVAELVVGAGHAGITRATAASTEQAGQVLVVEEMPQAGGSAVWEGSESDTRRALADLAGRGNVQIWTDTLCFGLYQEGPVLRAALRRSTPEGEELWEVTADRITLCTGAHDAHPEFPNNDLPGILAWRGAMRLLGEHKVSPGKVAVVHGSRLGRTELARLQNAGVQVAAQGTVVAAKGTTSVEAVQIEGRPGWIECDTVLCNEAPHPRVELYQQAGARLTWRGGRMAPAVDARRATSVPSLFAGSSHVAQPDLGSPLGDIAGEP